MFRSWSSLNLRVPQPTSFDGIKPSFMEWSEATTDYQEFIPLLTAVASLKDVIQADVMCTGVLSDIIEEIKKNGNQVKKEADRTQVQAENKPQEVQDFTKESQDMVTELTTKGKLNSDSSAVTGLKIWRQVTIHFAGSAKPRTVSLLKRIMSPAEWNVEKSKDVIKQYYHWRD